MLKKNITRASRRSLQLQGLPGSKRGIGALVFAGIVLGIINIALFYPGLYSYDSNDQLCQVMGDCGYANWHPISMVLLWSLLVTVTGHIASLFFLQIILIWVSLGLFAVYVYRNTGRFFLSLLVLGVGLLPNILNLSGTVEKSVLLTWCIGLAVSMILCLEFTKRYVTRAVICILIVSILLYAASLRTGTFIATLPILLWLTYIISSWSKSQLYKKITLAGSAIVIVCSVLIIGLIQDITSRYHAVYSTSSSVTMYALDIANIYSSQEIKTLNIQDGELKKYLQNLSESQCSYSSGADTIEVNVWLCAGADRIKILGSDEKIGEIRSIWKKAITEKPFKYAAFKIDTYLGFLIPGSDNSHVIYVDSWTNSEGMDYIAKYGTAPHKITIHIVDQWASSFGYRYLPFLYAAWFWLFLSIVGVFVSIKYLRKQPHYTYGALALCSSALLYILSYAPGSLPSNYRYYYWSVVAVIFAAFLLYLSRRNLSRNDTQ